MEEISSPHYEDALSRLAQTESKMTVPGCQKQNLAQSKRASAPAVTGWALDLKPHEGSSHNLVEEGGKRSNGMLQKPNNRVAVGRSTRILETALIGKHQVTELCALVGIEDWEIGVQCGAVEGGG
jgi:hypothetical protein